MIRDINFGGLLNIPCGTIPADFANWLMLKDAAVKIGKKNSVKGCILLLVILYVDLLDIKNIRIPTGTLRIAAWTRKLLDKVIKLNTNCDGSFGKLKFKQSCHSVGAGFSLQMDDISRFVTSKASRQLATKKKRKICEVVSKALNDVTEALDTFIQDLCASEESSGTNLRRCKRRRAVQHHDEEESEEDSDYKEEDGAKEDSDYGDEDDEEGTTAMMEAWGLNLRMKMGVEMTLGTHHLLKKMKISFYSVGG
ncbi:hypothetical protein C2845_PM03G30990 [Panicum miliaceum]|uniref:Uncharacterized protein n=1 Tax=Panicum miliaceum TaxID=4540 RepID=A0A3L6T9L6_PANMI|nr:hypothetical protein C2845_PM03G30990 [Panicum miliaceum]